MDLILPEHPFLTPAHNPADVKAGGELSLSLPESNNDFYRFFSPVRHQETLWELWIACTGVCTHLAHVSEVACLSPCGCWADDFYLCGRSPQKFDGTSKQSVFPCTGHVPGIRWSGFHHGHALCHVHTTAFSPEDCYVVQTETLCPEGALVFLSSN